MFLGNKIHLFDGYKIYFYRNKYFCFSHYDFKKRGKRKRERK